MRQGALAACAEHEQQEEVDGEGAEHGPAVGRPLEVGPVVLGPAVAHDFPVGGQVRAGRLCIHLDRWEATWDGAPIPSAELDRWSDLLRAVEGSGLPIRGIREIRAEVEAIAGGPPAPPKSPLR